MEQIQGLVTLVSWLILLSFVHVQNLLPTGGCFDSDSGTKPTSEEYFMCFDT